LHRLFKLCFALDGLGSNTFQQVFGQDHAAGDLIFLRHLFAPIPQQFAPALDTFIQVLRARPREFVGAFTPISHGLHDLLAIAAHLALGERGQQVQLLDVFGLGGGDFH